MNKKILICFFIFMSVAINAKKITVQEAFNLYGKLQEESLSSLSRGEKVNVLRERNKVALKTILDRIKEEDRIEAKVLKCRIMLELDYSSSEIKNCIGNIVNDKKYSKELNLLKTSILIKEKEYEKAYLELESLSRGKKNGTDYFLTLLKLSLSDLEQTKRLKLLKDYLAKAPNRDYYFSVALDSILQVYLAQGDWTQAKEILKKMKQVICLQKPYYDNIEKFLDIEKLNAGINFPSKIKGEYFFDSEKKCLNREKLLFLSLQQKESKEILNKLKKQKKYEGELVVLSLTGKNSNGDEVSEDEELKEIKELFTKGVYKNIPCLIDKNGYYFQMLSLQIKPFLIIIKENKSNSKNITSLFIHKKLMKYI